MNILDEAKTRNIVEFEKWEHTEYDGTVLTEYSLGNSRPFFHPGLGVKVRATTDEILLASNILHCLSKIGDFPKRMVLSQTLPHREWFESDVKCVRIDIDLYQLT